MLELTMTPSTVILLAGILAAAVLAVRRLVKRGMCDCGDGNEASGGCAHCAKKCAGTDGCDAVAAMLAHIEIDDTHDHGPSSPRGSAKLMAPTPFAR